VSAVKVWRVAALVHRRVPLRQLTIDWEEAD
jgi:hypothetical protein